MATSLEIPTIQESANPDRNTAMGGHLTQHIYGMNPPNGKSQQGKTLFAKRKDFENAWRQYRGHFIYLANGAAVNCSGRQAQQSVSLEKLGMRYIEAMSCKTVDGNNCCQTYDSYMTQSIFFGFLLVERKWILNTCFPEPL